MLADRPRGGDHARAAGGQSSGDQVRYVAEPINRGAHTLRGLGGDAFGCVQHARNRHGRDVSGGRHVAELDAAIAAFQPATKRRVHPRDPDDATAFGDHHMFQFHPPNRFRNT